MISTLFRSWFSDSSGRGSQRIRQVRPGVEMLEDRTLMTAGSLDPTFGVGGVVLTDFGNTADTGTATAIQRDGKIIVVGSSDQSGTGLDFALARYNPNGSLDPSFGIGGKVTTDFGDASDTAMAVAVEHDGKIVVAGYSYQPGTGYDFAVARYNRNGSLDRSFGDNGKVTTDLGSQYDWGESIVVQSDGKLIMGGITYRAGTLDDFALVRYNANGTVDTTFGNHGMVFTDFAGRYDFLYKVLLQPDGKILADGTATESLGEGMAVVRYNRDGSLDPSFGTGGKAFIYFFDFGEFGRGAVLAPNGKILLYGDSYQENTDNDFTLIRLNPNGSLDTTFGIGGEVTTDFQNNFDIGTCVVVQPNGKIVAGGYSEPDDGSIHFALARYNTDGTLDKSFGTNGEVVTNLAGDAFMTGLVLQRNGAVVAVGHSTQPGTGEDFTLVGYQGK